MTPSILYPTELSLVRCGSQLSMLELLATRDRSFYRRIVVCPPGDAYVAEVEDLGVQAHVAGTHPERWRFSPLQLAGTTRDLFAAAQATADLTERENVRLIHVSSLVAALAAAYAKRRHPHVRMVLHERGLAYRAHTRVLFRMVAGVMDRVLTTTEFGRRQLLAYGVAPAKIVVIPNGTDFHRQEPGASRASVRASLGVPNGARMIGMVANMAPVKRHALFIDMLSRMPGVYGVIAGGVLPLWDGEAYERQLRARVDALGLRDRVFFAGMRDDVPDVMRAMDVLVCPSQHESFGRVLIEAMAVGTPVVATAAGAIPDVVDHGRTGILAADDAQELANAAGRLLEDPREVERLTTAAREEVERRFDVRDVTRRIEDVYRELLDE